MSKEGYYSNLREILNAFSLNVPRLRDIHCTLVLSAESRILFLHAPLSMSIHNPSSDIALFCIRYITGSKAGLVEVFKP